MPGLKDAPRMYRVLKQVLPPITNRYFRTRVEGLDEHVPLDEPAILACNHLSFIDSILLPVAIPRPVYYLGKADYWDSWKTRWFFQGTGVVPVQRAGKGSGDAALATGVDILRRGELLGIYPEGTRSPDGRLYRGKTGPVRMALEAGVPIIPCAVLGTDRAMPTGKYIPNRHPVTVRYGAPLDFSRYADRRTDPFVLRSATDELMFEIMLLSEQEYVDEYAAKVKSGHVRLGEDEAGGTTVEIDVTDETTSRRAG
ncbi:lysophospholipid acyltransferase family protein [Nitriliruptor alkaliphilus]|uniref:lysophospholipid acyltransferase family protein n=1 Tax=Nitriliruptor alkaliphilus TaxID=427918 RepID=UPI000A764E96|nr:lysophospholipid acyltransferase family protein [Nitriliruptor alkaliphilus]